MVGESMVDCGLQADTSHTSLVLHCVGDAVALLLPVGEVRLNVRPQREDANRDRMLCLAALSSRADYCERRCSAWRWRCQAESHAVETDGCGEVQ